MRTILVFMLYAISLSSCLKKEDPLYYQTIDQTILDGGSKKTWSAAQVHVFFYAELPDTLLLTSSNDSTINEQIAFKNDHSIQFQEKLAKLLDVPTIVKYSTDKKKGFKYLFINDDQNIRWEIDKYWPSDERQKEAVMFYSHLIPYGKWNDAEYGIIRTLYRCWIKLIPTN